MKGNSDGLEVRAFIQARMTSSRFPGKVLAPFRGRPVIAHVVEHVRNVMPDGRVVLATTTEASDDPLALYVRELGVPVFRGSRDDVVGRFQACLREYPCDWFFRISGDSPLLDSTVIGEMLPYGAREDLDIVTNVYPRSYPVGRSVELVRSGPFAALDSAALTPQQREHVTLVYYERPSDFRILNLIRHPARSGLQLAVDTVDDLRRLEDFTDA